MRVEGLYTHSSKISVSRSWRNEEDSNGESTFEFVDKKSEETASEAAARKESNTNLPTSSTQVLSTSGKTNTGNFLSSVAPPSELPSFISASSESVPITPASTSVFKDAPPMQTFHEATFSPVIPPSKGADGIPLPVAELPEDEGAGGGLLGWVKGAIGTGGLLFKVAEKAKHSVDSMITTLDPQMREFLHSGGDVDIIVASDKEVKISPVREAFQAVFGKATVTGLAAQTVKSAAQPVGFTSAIKAAEERISSTRSTHQLSPFQPILAIENFLLEISDGKWYDVGILLLHDPGRGITLQTFTQLTPVPAAIVALAQEDTPADYLLQHSGLAVTIGSLMGSNLQVQHTEWHQALTGVSRREMLLLAAKSLAGLYKSTISSIL